SIQTKHRVGFRMPSPTLPSGIASTAQLLARGRLVIAAASPLRSVKTDSDNVAALLSLSHRWSDYPRWWAVLLVWCCLPSHAQEPPARGGGVLASRAAGYGCRGGWACCQRCWSVEQRCEARKASRASPACLTVDE